MEHKQRFAESAKRWAALSETDKEPWYKKVADDKKRYDGQMEELKENGFFIMADGSKSTDITFDPKKKYAADVVLPKRALTAYFFYTGEMASKIRAEVDGRTHMEAMKIAAERWGGTMTEADKEKYLQQNAKDQKRYEDQMAELATKGFFIMEDGSKSCDHTKKIK